MATDIAKIGFGVETSQLEKGVATLNSFSASAKSANNSAKSVGTAMNSAAKVFAAAVAGMSKSIASLVSVTQGATAEQIKAANEAAEFADRVYRAAQAQDKLAASTQKVTAAVKGQYNAFLKAASNESVLNRINRVTGVTGLTGMSAKLSVTNIKQGKTAKEWAEAIGETPRDMMPNRFNTANIAAQFQDIGVTAAMGMNPLLIALQQGTQLAAVMNSMEKPIQGLADAFKQIINPVSLLSIGLTALAVVGLQMVDWTGLAQSALNGLSFIMDGIASGFEFLADNVEVLIVVLGTFTSVLIGFNLTSIIASFKSLGETIYLAYLYFLDFVKDIPSLMKQAGTVIASVAKFIINPWILIPAVVIGVLEAFATFKDSVKSILNGAIDFIIDFVNKGIGYFVGFKNVLFSITDIIKSFRTDGLEGARTKISSIMDEALSKEYIDKDAIKENVNAAVDYAADGILKVNNAISSGIGKVSDVISSGASSVRDFASGLTETTDKTQKLKDAWKDLQNQVNQDIASSQLEQRLIGVDTYTSEYEKTRADLTNQATNAGIPLTPEKIAYIDQAAQSTARYRDETEKLTDSFNNVKSISGSFFQDLRQDLWDGVGAWQAFGNAALNVLDNILSKMLDIGVDYLFDAVGAAGTSGGTSKFSWSSVASSIGSWFSGSPAPAAAANGGAFTNGVYNSPTLFKFANGGQFGVMGEAGPEAVMPLRRGPDGSLGVQADGVGKDVVVNVYNNSNAQASVNQRQTSQGTEIDVMIDQLVAEKMSQPGTSSNSALTAFNNRRLITR